ncbi:hypothetical protein BDQ17DRAFT_1466518 [Cyathus striatus]|nr:hypothetical protein BDQ17DRAFT_1466518 [Cyathus striatus]
MAKVELPSCTLLRDNYRFTPIAAVRAREAKARRKLGLYDNSTPIDHAIQSDRDVPDSESKDGVGWNGTVIHVPSDFENSEGLESVPIQTIRKWELRMIRWMNAYHEGLGAKEAQTKAKQSSSRRYTSHRRIHEAVATAFDY